MLSKMKSSNAPDVARKLAASYAASDNELHEEEEDGEDDVINNLETTSTTTTTTTNTLNDSNNNNNDDKNLNNNIQKQQQPSGKNEDELLDIVEVSRKRRLSKNSADSLSRFIKWSFTNVTEPKQNLNNNNNSINLIMENLRKNQQDDLMLGNDEEDEWQNNNNNNNNHHHNNNSDFIVSKKNKFQLPEQLLQLQRNQQQGGGCNSSATNLAIIKSLDQSALVNEGLNNSLNNLLEQAQPTNRVGLKRPRTQVYSPEANNNNKFNSSSGLGGGLNLRKSASGLSRLGSVVDRLHNHHQKQHQSIQQQQQQVDQQDNNADISLHLQQFLQQSTSLENLCSSIGLDDNNQLVLAAAIHRALVDSVGSNQGSNQPLETKSTASSTGSSSGGSGSSSSNLNSNNSSQQQTTSGQSSQSNNFHLVDSINRQRRAYNTRAALHGLNSPAAVNQQSNNNNRQLQQASALNKTTSRLQQQRHAQAAAALSALASAGSQQQQQQSNPLNNHHLQTAAHHLHGPAGSTTTPIVDFECDTCGSSFDDRHRLMQHQSIHLELKKDWFTETPVDEVMKIFNRRRGEFLCNTCNLRFEATFDYDKHNHSVHGQRPYCCQFCGNGTRTFRFWRQYLNHLYDHRYIFSCTIDDCDFTVNRRDSLRFHIFRFHLNCQLPQQQQHQQLRAGHNMLLGNNNNNNCDSKWPTLDEDEDNDMNIVGE